MTLRPHHGKVAAAILGPLIGSGRLAGPCAVDLPRLAEIREVLRVTTSCGPRSASTSDARRRVGGGGP
jgi:hypothetical protein